METRRSQNLSKNTPEKSSNSHISLLGHITQIELNEEICTNDIFNGFVNRCLWIYSERSKLLPFGGKTIDFLDYVDLFYAFKLPPNKKIISLDDSARSYWAQIYQNENMDLPIPDDQQSVVEARGTDQILRMALVYAVADQSNTIKCEHLEASLSVWKYSKLSSGFILGSANKGPGKNQEKLLNFLSAKKSATRTEIRDLFQRNLSADEINKIKDNINKSYNKKTRSIGPTKSRCWREIPISSDLELLLKELKLKSDGNKFVLPRLGYWKTGAQAKVIRQFALGLGLPEINLHTTRACFATQLIKDGVAPAVVMKIGGWKDLKTMQHYIRLAGIEIEGTTDKLKILPEEAVMGRVVELFQGGSK